uniref:Protein DMP4 n=1 Tax=Vitis vinifera TaxID=29760 RepID=A5B913_VITVI|nr:hypothetical protein VITISV_028557 [Vitis vinifera]
MEFKVEDEESWHLNDQKVTLLQDMPRPQTGQRTPIQMAISQTFQSTAHLANLLPTGTVLAFQFLSPVLTNKGECDPVSRFMTSSLLALCGMSCFLQCFTDSFRDNNGNVYYGFATFRGLWIIDGSATLPPELAAEYQLRFIDFIHAFMSILVFAAIALFDENVVNCFYPTPSDETKELLTSLPVGIGVFCSYHCLNRTSTRHRSDLDRSSTGPRQGREDYWEREKVLTFLDRSSTGRPQPVDRSSTGRPQPVDRFLNRLALASIS